MVTLRSGRKLIAVILVGLLGSQAHKEEGDINICYSAALMFSLYS